MYLNLALFAKDYVQIVDYSLFNNFYRLARTITCLFKAIIIAINMYNKNTLFRVHDMIRHLSRSLDI